MKIILISGHAGNGKDTAAALIKTKLETDGNTVLITHFGDLLKYVCKTFFGWNGLKDEYGRSMMQHVGTDIVRKYDKDFWVKFVSNILRMFNAWDYVLIPDARFKNEIEVSRKYFGSDVQHWRIVRNKFDSKLTGEQQKHISETELDDVEPDIFIHNDGDITELAIQLNKIIEERLYDEGRK